MRTSARLPDPWRAESGLAHPVRESTEADRRLRIYRSWKRTSYDCLTSRWWQTWRLGTAAMLVQLAALLGMAASELVLWGVPLRDLVPPPLRALPDPALGAATVLVLCGNALLVDRLLRRKAASGDRIPHRFRVATLLVGSLPVVNLLMISWFRKRSGSSPAGVREAGKGRGSGPAGLASLALRWQASALRIRFEAGLRRLEQSLFWPVWFAGVNLLLVLLLQVRLALGAGGAEPSAGVLLLTAAGCHLTAFGAALLARREPEPTSATVRPGAPWLEAAWLLPLPIPLVWFLLAELNPPGEWRRSGSLSRAALLGAGTVAGDPLWRGLRRSLGAPWRERPRGTRWRWSRAPAEPRELAQGDRRFLAAARWKAGQLLVDGLALGMLLEAAGSRGSAAAALAGAAFVLLAGVGLLAIGCCLVLKAVHQLAIWLGVQGGLRTLDREPHLRLVAFGQLAFLPGLFAGLFFAQGSIDQGVVVLALGGALGMMAAGLTLLVGGVTGSAVARDPRDVWYWSILFLAMMLAALPLAALALLLPRLPVFGLVLAGSVLCGALLRFAVARRLIHPWRPDELRSTTAPGRVRQAAAAVRTAAALPLGGLTVPVWLLLRRQVLAPAGWSWKAMTGSPPPGTGAGLPEVRR